MVRGAILAVGTIVGYYFNWLPYLLQVSEDGWRYLIAGGLLLVMHTGIDLCPTWSSTSADLDHAYHDCMAFVLDRVHLYPLAMWQLNRTIRVRSADC